MCRETAAPRRVGEVDPGFLDGIVVDIDGVDNGARVALGNHQGDDTAAGPDVKDAAGVSDRTPCAQQNAVGAHFHRRAIVQHSELLEPENLFSSHNRVQR